MIERLMGWLVFPGLIFQTFLAFATAWIEAFLAGLFGFRQPPTPLRFFLHWVKGFVKKPVPIRFDYSLFWDVLVIIATGWLGLAVFSGHGMDGDIPLITMVFSLAVTKRQPFSFFRCVQLGGLILGFSISGIFPGATFRMSDVMQFQENYGPLIGMPAGAVAAVSMWIGLAFPVSRLDETAGPAPGPISVLSDFLCRSGFIWLWTVCFAGGSWHGLSALRMILSWWGLVLSFALTRFLPRLRERTRRRLNLSIGAAVLAAVLLAWGGRGS
jgi:hypothetical protein